jgi:O-acetyl-ADP-ribose deacetylase (regulator of RNase III)
MKPEKPGSVLVKATSPLQLLAVVHDLNQEPSWKEEWVAKALEEIFRETEQRKLHSLALPFLGTRHGSLDKERFLVLLRSTLEGIVTHSLKRIWLMLPPDIDPGILKVLKFKHRKKRGRDTKNP